MPRSSFALLAIGILLAACGSTTMTRTSIPSQPREKNCHFDLLTTAPAGYLELATIDVQPGSYASNVYTNLGDLKEKVQPLVCKAGGDLAVAQANGYGMYMKVTVLKRAVMAPPPFPMPAATPPLQNPADNGGCRYDTQCKGDRICVNGVCVEPNKG